MLLAYYHGSIAFFAGERPLKSGESRVRATAAGRGGGLGVVAGDDVGSSWRRFSMTTPAVRVLRSTSSHMLAPCEDERADAAISLRHDDGVLGAPRGRRPRDGLRDAATSDR